jgi:hypothetical protein
MTAQPAASYPWSVGALQILDLKYLRGINMAILPVDVLVR